jgi:hypothetical protein
MNSNYNLSLIQRPHVKRMLQCATVKNHVISRHHNYPSQCVLVSYKTEPRLIPEHIAGMLFRGGKLEECSLDFRFLNKIWITLSV